MSDSIGVIHPKNNSREFEFQIVFLKANGSEIRRVKMKIYAKDREEANAHANYLAWEEMTDSVSRFRIEEVI